MQITVEMWLYAEDAEGVQVRFVPGLPDKSHSHIRVGHASPEIFMRKADRVAVLVALRDAVQDHLDEIAALEGQR